MFWQNNSKKSIRIFLSILMVASVLFAGVSQAQTMDYNLNQAKRSLASIASGLERLQQNDINGFNRLVNKFNKAGELLQTSESQSHPEFAPTVQQWTLLQQQLSVIASSLQQAQSQQQKALQDQQAKQAAEADKIKQDQAAQQRQLAEQRSKKQSDIDNRSQARLDKLAKQKELDRVHQVTLNEILAPMKARYNRGSLPKLADKPTAQQAQEWANSLHQLQTKQMQQDLAKIETLLAEGKTNDEDARQAKYWISNGSQGAISEIINNARLVADGEIVSMEYSANLINAVDPNNQNEAYRFAGSANYTNNKQRLNNAIRAGQVVSIFNSVFGAADHDRTELLAKIKLAIEHLELLKPAADRQAIVLANAEPAERTVNNDFLAPIAQEYWLDGSIVAESDNEGGIWLSGVKEADITHNGEIWYGGVQVGSIEPNGEVWYEGNQIGSLEPNGEIWRNGTQAGLIEQTGQAWINGLASGEIVPFQGEWKRAAIIYYFPDIFTR